MFPVASVVLILSPHTDDGEIGCGGTIHRLIQEGHTVHYFACSSCADSLPPEYPPDTLKTEVRAATARLGVDPANLHLREYPVRRFNDHRQAILDELIEIKAQVNPDVVFVPSRDDLHQDHAVVAAEAMRAFKDRTVLAYEMPWNNVGFETRAFVALTADDIDAKVAALGAYESQLHRPYMNEQFIRSLAYVRGSSIRAAYAEVFDAVRVVLR